MSFNAQRLAHLLVQTPPPVTAADLPLLQASGLTAEVAARLPVTAELRSTLQALGRPLLARTMNIRRELIPLLRAWAAADINCLILKGLAMDEFVYATSGQRPYGDVDVLLREGNISQALDLAVSLGWRSDNLSDRPNEWTHEMAHLLSPGGHVRLDVHRYLVEWTGGPKCKVKRVTAGVWQRSRQVKVHDVNVRTLHPTDMALHLALARGWSGDGGACKPADYPDLHALIVRHHLKPDMVARRATELGARHTWQAYLRMCNPWQHHFVLDNPHGARRLRWAARRDGKWWPLPWPIRRVLNSPLRLKWMWRTWPDVWAVKRQLQHVGDPRALPADWPLKEPIIDLGHRQQVQLINAVFLWVRLLYPKGSGTCVPKALTTYRALVRLGYPAVFVSGVRRSEQGIEGHAWVEGPVGPLDAYEHGLNAALYRTVFEHRSVPASALLLAADPSGHA